MVPETYPLEPIELLLLVGSFISVLIIAIVLPFAARAWRRKGMRRPAILALAVLPTLMAPVISYAVMTAIAANISRQRWLAGNYKGVLTGEARLGDFLVWLGAVVLCVSCSALATVAVTMRPRSAPTPSSTSHQAPGSQDRRFHA